MAWVKGDKSQPIKKLLSNATIFGPIDFTNIEMIAYSPDHNLDEDAYFCIQDFKNKDFFSAFLKTPFNSVDFNSVKSDDFDKISYIFSVQDGIFYFQKVTPASFLTKKTISLGNIVEIEENKKRIIIRDIPDAIYVLEKDILIFRKLPTISSIFHGIDLLYKEATDEQVSDFLSSDFITLTNDFNKSKVSKPNRKRIALALDTLSKMSSDDKKTILEYIRNYCGKDIIFNEDLSAFSISSDIDLKHIVYGIEERFYTTICGGERRLANSIVTLPESSSKELCITF